VALVQIWKLLQFEKTYPKTIESLTQLDFAQLAYHANLSVKQEFVLILTLLSQRSQFSFFKTLGRLFDTDEYSEQYYTSL